jgi:fumarate hydratase class II
MGYRIEKDTLGEIKVPVGKYWGAQTQRSLENFPFESTGNIQFPKEFISALGIVKRACAEVNNELGILSKEIASPIIQAAQEVIDGKFDSEFPLKVFGQSGSGTQTNMNINEVISNRAIELTGGILGSKSPIHPNDHVNCSQSSNDVIPTAMHVSAVMSINKSLVPGLDKLKITLKEKEDEFKDTVKTGRTHLMDASPITLGQEFSGYVTQIENGIKRVNNSITSLYELAIGGTAVGTGLNSHPEFSEKVAAKIAEITKLPFNSGKNKFEGIAAHDAVVEVSGALKVVAVSLMKIANDIRWLGSGPRTGLGELHLPKNEPGSSIMPGKVNPTQSESVTQVVTQIIGNDVTISIAGSQGNFELNAFKPVMIYNLLQSIQLLANVSVNFADKCVKGITVNREKLDENLERNLMLVTRLSPLIGYDKAAAIAQEALETGKTLRELLLTKNMFSKDKLDQILDPKQMLFPEE